MKSLLAEQSELVRWLIGIGKIQQAGQVTCPLMFEPGHAGRFAPAVCVCDLPNTREEFFRNPQNKTCFDAPASACIPAQELPAGAEEERRNTLPPRRHNPRGAWTMHLRKDGPSKPWWEPYNGHQNQQ